MESGDGLAWRGMDWVGTDYDDGGSRCACERERKRDAEGAGRDGYIGEKAVVVEGI
jgi:hypothetical protein